MMACVVYLLLGCAAFVLLGWVTDWLFRGVNYDMLFSALFNRVADRFLLGGRDRARVFVHHRTSGMLFVILKRLWPDRDPDGKLRLPGYEESRDCKVELVVRVIRLHDPMRFESRRKKPRRLIAGWTAGMFTPYWQVPSEQDGDLLEEIDCGCSLTKLEGELSRLTLENEAIGAGAVFDVWCERCYMSQKYGHFED